MLPRLRAPNTSLTFGAVFRAVNQYDAFHTETSALLIVVGDGIEKLWAPEFVHVAQLV